MNDVKILGIVGSPRRGNTEILVREALMASETLDDVETELLHIGSMKINPCRACFRCFEEGTRERLCLSYDDDMKMVYPKLIEADGIILGSPVYFGGISAQLKTMLDRTEPLVRYSKTGFGGRLSNKVGGAIVVGYNRNGGQETAIQMLHHFFLVHDMVIVGSGPEETPGCYYGGCGVTYPKRSSVVNAVMADELGLRSSRGLGRRVAEVAKLVKTGLGLQRTPGEK